MRCHLPTSLVLLIAAAMGLAPVAGAAQPTKPAPATPAAAPTAAPAPSSTPPPTGASPAEPQRTTASFGDWVVRCEQAAAGPKLCEAAQIASNAQGQAVAQLAMGRLTRSEPMRMTLLVPTSVTLGIEPRLVGRDTEKALPPIDLLWRRCLPGGCVADATLRDDAVAKLRGLTEAYRLVFQDGAGREATLPFSPKGLSQALDALAREEPR